MRLMQQSACRLALHHRDGRTCMRHVPRNSHVTVRNVTGAGLAGLIRHRLPPSRAAAVVSDAEGERRGTARGVAASGLEDVTHDG